MDPAAPTSLPVTPVNPPQPGVISPQPSVTPQAINQTNTSGMGKDSIVPEEVKGWSWAAFLWNWIWGIAHKVWLGFLMFIPIPILPFAIMIILGAKGNEWAWKNKKWESVEAFKKTQRKWAIWGLVLVAFAMLGIITVALLAAIDPQKQIRRADCAKNCQTSTDTQACMLQCQNIK